MAEPANTRPTRTQQTAPQGASQAAPQSAPQAAQPPQANAAAPAAAAAVTTMSTRRAQTLREAQVRKLPTSRLKPIGHFSDPQQAMLPAEWDFADALKPEFWTFIAPGMQANVAASVLHDRVGTIFDVHAEDNAFYGRVIVHGLRRNKEGTADALYVTCIGPVYDPETDKCYPVNVKTGGIWRGRPGKAEAV